MSAAPWTVGRYVVETLAANGIDTVFGIPGVHNLELYRGLELARLRHVLVRHEQNAGFAADGYARATAHPAAAFVISGPGVTNALTALAQAYSDSVPLLVVASSPVRRSLGQRWGVLHELHDQRALAADVTGLRRQRPHSPSRCATSCAPHLPRCAGTGRAPPISTSRSICWPSRHLLRPQRPAGCTSAARSRWRCAADRGWPAGHCAAPALHRRRRRACRGGRTAHIARGH